MYKVPKTHTATATRSIVSRSYENIVLITSHLNFLSTYNRTHFHSVRWCAFVCGLSKLDGVVMRIFAFFSGFRWCLLSIHKLFQCPGFWIVSEHKNDG